MNQLVETSMWTIIATLILSAILEIALIVKFWKMCDDVRKIKENKEKKRDISQFNKGYYKFLIEIGETEKAKEHLLSHIRNKIEERFEFTEKTEKGVCSGYYTYERFLNDKEKKDKALEIYKKYSN